MPKLKIQLHIHTKQDPLDNIKHSEKQKIAHAAKLGYDAIAITCHNVVIFNEDLHQYAKSKRILLIPGIEKSIERKHVLILNADIHAQKINNFNDLRLYKKNNPDCLIIAAHPYYPGWVSLGKKLEENIDAFDAIEYSWFHSKQINKSNKKAIKIAETHRLPMVGTSDNHLLRHFDQTYSIVDAEKNTKSIFKAIKEKKVSFVSHDLPLLKMVWIVIEMSIRNLIKKVTLR